jgi:uncharacterized damage-inducible protein DinB
VTLDLLQMQLAFNSFIITKNIEDLDHADSRFAPAAGGNSINWVLGHIIANRDQTLRLLGRETIWNEKKRALYWRGAPHLEAERMLDFAAMKADLEAGRQRIASGLAALTPDQLPVTAAFSPTGGEPRPLGLTLAGLMSHEAYHAGQIGVLRRVAGKPGVLQ